MKTRVVSSIFAVSAVLAVSAFAADKSPAATPTNAPAVSTTSKTNEVVARVNGKSITRKELDAAVQEVTIRMARSGRPIPPGQGAEVQRAMLEKLIGIQLLLEEGNKHIPADIDKKVQEEWDRITTQVGGEDQLKKMLAENGATLDESKKQIRDNIIIRNTIEDAVDRQVTITPEEIKAYYDKNHDRFKQPETVRASHILILVPADATDEVKKEKRTQIESVLALFKHGDKFADLARKFSEDPGSAKNGGDLGFFPQGQMVPEFDAAAFSLKTNEVSDIITTQYGYHLLLVTDRRPPQIAPFEQVKDELGLALKQRKSADMTRTYVATLRKAAKVEILDAKLEPLPELPSIETAPVQAPTK